MRRFRLAIQLAFLGLTLAAGWQFLRFYQFLLDPSADPVRRPPSVEGFLPISASLAFRQWLHTGVFDPIHPAGLTLFLLICGSALLLGRAFCGWICPVGTVSEYWGRFGSRVLRRFGRKPMEPGKPARIALGLLKYLLLGFFVYICGFALGIDESIAFLHAPYNQVADIKMLLLFLEPGKITRFVLALLFAAGLVVPHFWCRFLCPYGAWLGVLGFLAPARISRDQAKCTGCRACTRACPSRLQPHLTTTMKSPSCTLCTSCSHSCPTSAIAVRIVPSSHRIVGSHATWAMGISIVALFFVGILAALLTGHWQSILTADDLRQWLPVLRSLKHH